MHSYANSEKRTVWKLQLGKWVEIDLTSLLDGEQLERLGNITNRKNKNYYKISSQNKTFYN